MEHKHSNAKRIRAGTRLNVRNWQFAPKARIISSFEEGEVKVIGDEPTNTDYDPGPSEKAVSRGGGRKHAAQMTLAVSDLLRVPRDEGIYWTCLSALVRRPRNGSVV